DLGNSPLEFTRERVAGRVICATTTNGTRALAAVSDVPVVFVAGFVNLTATVRAVWAALERRELRHADARVDGDARHVHIVCAGSEGEPSAEDSLCAEWMAAALRGAAHPGAHPA